MRYWSAEQEYATRAYQMYCYIDDFYQTKKSRKRKEYLRKIFNMWYKCPSPSGVYDETYWKFVIDWKNAIPVRKLIGDNMKILTNGQFIKFVKELDNRHYKHNYKQ